MGNKPIKIQTPYDEVFVDGSAYVGKKAYGIGGIVICHNDLRLCDHFSLPLYGSQSSQTAEIYAVVHALNTLPENSRIVVHNDLTKLCDKINQGGQAILEWQQKCEESKKHKKRTTALACADLFNAVSRHKEVVAVLEGKNSRDLMNLAHQLAQEGATGITSKGAAEASPDHETTPKKGYKSYDHRQERKGSRSRQRNLAVAISIELSEPS